MVYLGLNIGGLEGISWVGILDLYIINICNSFFILDYSNGYMK